MTFSELAIIAWDVLMVGGAIAMMIFLIISIYMLTIVRKVYGVFKTIKWWYEAVQERIQIPMMLVTAFLAKQWMETNDKKKK